MDDVPAMEMDMDENYLYGEKRGGREERDPRKRKRQINEMGYEGGTGCEERKDRVRSSSRDRSGSMGRNSSSESPEDSYRKGEAATREGDDSRKKKCEDFLQNPNIAPSSNPCLAAGRQGCPGVGGGGQVKRQQQNYQVCFNWLWFFLK